MDRPKFSFFERDDGTPKGFLWCKSIRMPLTVSAIGMPAYFVALDVFGLASPELKETYISHMRALLEPIFGGIPFIESVAISLSAHYRAELVDDVIHNLGMAWVFAIILALMLITRLHRISSELKALLDIINSPENYAKSWKMRLRTYLVPVSSFAMLAIFFFPRVRFAALLARPGQSHWMVLDATGAVIISYCLLIGSFGVVVGLVGWFHLFQRRSQKSS